MSEIIDRRENPRHKSAVNQQRFLRRYRAQVREAVARAISGRKIAETDRDASISIPARDLAEPTFAHGRGMFPAIRFSDLAADKGKARARDKLRMKARARTNFDFACHARSFSISSSRTWSSPISLKRSLPECHSTSRCVLGGKPMARLRIFRLCVPCASRSRGASRWPRRTASG
jgi:hypothetical protein